MNTLLKLTATCAFGAILLSAAGAAQATELLANGSFEGPDIPDGSYTYPGLPYGSPFLPSSTQDSWTYTGSALVGAVGGNDWYGGSRPSGQDGDQFAALQGTSTLSQVFTSVGTSLDLSWLAAGRPDFGGYAGYQDYQVSLGSFLSPVYSTVSGQNFTAQSWHVGGLTAGANYTLTFVGLDTIRHNGVADQTSFIDKVSAVGSVPEPASWGLMIVGLGGVGAMMRRRRLGQAIAA